MAAEDRTSGRYLAFLKEAAQAPRKWGLFALVRGASARAQDKPPVGRSKRPEQDIVELRQVPHMHFPASTLEEVEFRKGRAILGGHWLGLTGPMAPMPQHITEFSMYERRYAKKRPFGDFLDLIAGRFLQLFYRAWAVSQPAVQADRPKTDQFSAYVAHLSGAAEGSHAGSAFPPLARLHYAALFASRRSAGAIEGGLSHLLDLPVRLREFFPVWRDLEVEDQTRLGVAHHRLGDALVGKRVLQVTDSFEVRVTARNAQQFASLLPSGRLFPIASEALTALAPSHLDWRLTVCLEKPDVEPARLDARSPLGWSSWLGQAETESTRMDVHLTRASRKYVPGGTP